MEEPKTVDGGKSRPEFLAHVDDAGNGQFRLHSLPEHLRAVAALAEDFATPFGAAEWARLAGLWHDLGKFQPAFQEYIRRGTGYDSAAHLEDAVPGRVDHSSVGALNAASTFARHGPVGQAVGRLLAYVIAGHHAGLPDWRQADGGSASL